MILIVRQPRDQHAAGQGVESVRPDHTLGIGDEVIDGFCERRLCRIGVHIENENSAGIQTTGPEELSIIGVPRVVSFIAPTY